MASSVSMQGNAVAEMNITPLVDVMLVLLVIFMVSVPLLSEPLQASLPQRPQAIPPVAPPALQLEIAADGTYRLDGRLLAGAELVTRLEEAMVQGDGRATLTVHADSDANYQMVVSALSMAHSSGLTDSQSRHRIGSARPAQ